MKIQGATALVTGANRGLGLAFARALLERGAAKVYAGARDPSSITLPGVVPIKLDVTKEDEVEAAAREASDVNLVINNAGIAKLGPWLGDGAIEDTRSHFEVNVLGPLRVARAFAPVLARNGGGALINVLSVASWINRPLLATYGASKAAAWALTNGLRIELEGQGTQVLGIHAGFIDTDMAREMTGPKTPPQAIVKEAFDALERGDRQVLADEMTRQVYRGLTAEQPVYLSAINAA
ncbi:SDR family oxidoreductase [Pseudorhodoplanes sp.]|jgi:NAD(P)-dependent dehydrogenase (short-subunit alcohol dehydrogenase family)|uniref:SDR family oxidoreductase n=1 Tax=Pseudorhodoplanes sp. TaxID=1934341 RepID=UPI002CE38DF9|nr:SDR family oxidoreductase [Pseudorhodoplanes sp.]HWV43191.1 SDR family oxidoreductase [Pseudorhodoplanes sp.]